MAANRVEEKEQLVNCLTNERVIVRFIPKRSTKITNPRHALYGGMAETSVRTFVVPRLSSGRFVNVLTNSEKAYLEHIMSLNKDDLSIYKREHNFWDDSNPDGISKVTLRKYDTYLDLSNPEDYIRYKILLANKDFIAPSRKSFEDYPKATYQYMLIKENDDVEVAKDNMSITMKCYKEYGKVEDNYALLKLVVELIDGRPISPSSKLAFIQTKINELIQSNPKTFLKVITDPMLSTKVLIRQSVEAGNIIKRGDFYYIKNGNLPMCEDNEDPTFNNASKFLNSPKHQELKFTLESQLKDK